MNLSLPKLRIAALLSIGLFVVGCSTSPEPKSDQAVEGDSSIEATVEQAPAEDAPNLVEIRRTHISFGGKEVADIRDYTLSSTDLSGDSSAMRIDPLFEALDSSELADDEPLVIRVRPEVPQRLLARVIHTAGESGAERIELEVESDFVDYHSVGLAAETPSSTRPVDVLRIGVTEEGFYVGSGENTLAPIEGCPPKGASVCVVNADASSVAKGVENFRMAARKGNDDWYQRFEIQLMDVYDFRRLYNVVAAWKSKNPNAVRVMVTVAPDMPAMLLSQTVLVVNSRLPEVSYESDEAFVAALEQADDGEARFADVLAGEPDTSSKTPTNAGMGSVFDGRDASESGNDIEAKLRGALVFGNVHAVGDVESDRIREVMEDARPKLQRCYEEQLQQTPDLSGRVTFNFTIAADGSVIAAKVKKSTLDNTSVESCAAARIRRLVFPEPESGGIVIVNYPVDFTPRD